MSLRPSPPRPAAIPPPPSETGRVARVTTVAGESWLVPTETHPGGNVSTSERDDGWRFGVADAWRACEHATTAEECRTAIAALGNKGPGR